MGEPAQLDVKDRDEARALAKRLLDVLRNDGSMMETLLGGRAYADSTMDLERTAIMQLETNLWILAGYIDGYAEELRAGVHEIAIYARPTPGWANAAELEKKIGSRGYTSELVPRLTEFGGVKVSDRVDALEKLAER